MAARGYGGAGWTHEMIYPATTGIYPSLNTGRATQNLNISEYYMGIFRKGSPATPNGFSFPLGHLAMTCPIFTNTHISMVIQQPTIMRRSSHFDGCIWYPKIYSLWGPIIHKLNLSTINSKFWSKKPLARLGFRQ